MVMDDELILYLKDVIYKGGEIALDMRDRGLDIAKKEDKSPVSDADLAVSDYIYQRITELDLNFPIICEEQLVREVGGNEFFWLIDPIDGTKSFIRGEDTFTVNIALIHNNQPSLGFILQPAIGRLYYTDQNGQLIIEHNGERIIIDVQKERHGDYAAIVSSNHFNKRTEAYISYHNIKEVIAVPSSIKLCMIAEGIGDIFPKFGSTKEWDIAAGHALIKAVGGRVTDLNGNEITYDKEDFSNPDFLAYGKRWQQQTY